MSAPLIALTIGDPNGIGPEIAVKAAVQMARESGPPIVLVGDAFVVQSSAERYASGLELRSFDGSAPLAGALYFRSVNSLPRAAYSPGTPVAEGGRATVDYLAAAIRLVNEGHASAIVACPHSETNVNAAGIPFSGYPGLLARLTGTPEDNVFLMLVGGGSFTSPCTSGSIPRWRASRRNWWSAPRAPPMPPCGSSMSEIRGSACSESIRMPARTGCSVTTTTGSRCLSRRSCRQMASMSKARSEPI
jgi:hypothetical protein